DSGKADRNRGECALNGHDREKVGRGKRRGRTLAHVFRMKRVGDEKKSGESRNMRDQRGAECKERRDPMPRVKMIGGRDLDQFIFAREFMGQEMEEIKSADDKTRDQTRNRNSKQNAQSDEQLMRSKTGFNCNRSSPEQIETKCYKRDRDGDQRDESDQTIENDSQKSASFMIRRLLKEQIT